MDHDRVFKELLSVFFVEFVEAFLPNVAKYLDPTSLEFLDKEVFTDVTAGDKHEVDLVVKARFRDEDTFFLIHVESQASARSDFPKRMYRYFSRLHEKYDLPVYPVVIFSYDTPLRPEPNRYLIVFPGETVLHFKYRVIQLNRLSWRKFVKQPNAAATALMAKMKIAPQDRVKVRSECMRLLRTLKLDPAKSKLIAGFIEAYLQLTAEEMKRYEREFAKLTPAEQEETMGLISSWEQKGIEKGIEQGIEQGQHAGKEDLIARQIERRIGSVSPQVVERLTQLSTAQLDELGVALLDFTSVADLEKWLARQ
jgi:hypothetical protein